MYVTLVIRIRAGLIDDCNETNLGILNRKNPLIGSSDISQRPYTRKAVNENDCGQVKDSAKMLVAKARLHKVGELYQTPFSAILGPISHKTILEGRAISG